MALSNLTGADALLVLGLFAALPAVVSGILGIYFHGRTVPFVQPLTKQWVQLSSFVRSRTQKRSDGQDDTEKDSPTESVEQGVLKMPVKPNRNNRPRKAA